MNKLNKTLLILAVIFIVSSAIGVALFLNSAGFIDYTSGNLNKIKINDNQIIKTNKIEINSLSTDIQIVKTNSDKIKVELSGEYVEGSYLEPPRLKTTEENDKTIVKIVYPRYKLVLGFAQKKLNLMVFIPENFSGNIEINSASGDVKGENFNSGLLDINSISGDVKIINLDSKYVEIESTSGDISLENSTSDKISTISGDVKINSKILRNLNVKTISGDVILDSMKSKNFKVYFKTISGDSNDISIFNGENIVNAETTSGDLIVY